MTELADYQRRFAQALRESDPAALSRIVAGDAAARGLVYVNNHVIGLSEALAGIYPVLQRLIGDDCFAAVARDYVHATPMRSGNVLDYGESFADFICRAAGLAALPYLADMARLEWIRHQIIHAPDADPDRRLQLQALAALDDEVLRGLHLQLIPAARCFDSAYPCVRIWQANQGVQSDSVSLDEGGVQCLATRPGLNFQIEFLSKGEWGFLQRLSEHALLDAAEHSLRIDPGFDLAVTLARWSPFLQYADRRRAT